MDHLIAQGPVSPWVWPPDMVQVSYAQAAYVHEWAQRLDPEHDSISCPCCCLDCDLEDRYVWVEGGGSPAPASNQTG